MNKLFSLASTILSASNLGMNMYINKQGEKARRKRMIVSAIMIAIAAGISFTNTRNIINRIEKNGCKQ